MAQLTLRHVSKQHAGGRRTVNDVSVEIEDGELVIVVGPSGCGKSTLLRMVAGLETVSEGQILIDGRIVNEVAARDRDIAMVFQNYALYPHMSVRENMGFALKMRGLPPAEIRERVKAAAEILDLVPLLERKPHALSGGQRQRVAVGRAIVRQPKLFLFDEPLSNLDAKLRGTMRAELIKLHRRLRATMLYVTHDQLEAMSLGDRVVVLKDGVVQQVGAPLEVYDRPVNRFVAGFLGSPPMNFFECAIEAGTPARLTAPDGFRVDAPRTSHPLPARVVFGIRPESLHERRAWSGPTDGCVAKARIVFVEPLGSEVLATCRMAGREAIARLPPNTAVKADDQVELVLDMERALLFDAESGASLR